MFRDPPASAAGGALVLIEHVAEVEVLMDERWVYLGGVEFAVVQLQDAQGRLQVGLGLRQLQLDGPQAVGVGGGQVHPQQRQIHLEDRSFQDASWMLRY